MKAQNWSANGQNKASACRRKILLKQGYDLSLNRYKEVKHEEVEYAAPKDIFKELQDIEKDIAKGMKELEEMLG